MAHLCHSRANEVLHPQISHSSSWWIVSWQLSFFPLLDRDFFHQQSGKINEIFLFSLSPFRSLSFFHHKVYHIRRNYTNYRVFLLFFLSYFLNYLNYHTWRTLSLSLYFLSVFQSISIHCCSIDDCILFSSSFDNLSNDRSGSSIKEEFRWPRAAFFR